MTDELDRMGAALLDTIRAVNQASGQTAAAGLVAVDELVDMLAEAGVVDRAAFLDRLKRRRGDLVASGNTVTAGAIGAMFPD
jgi:hypothetical protein